MSSPPQCLTLHIQVCNFISSLNYLHNISIELIDNVTSNVVIDLSHWNVNVDFGLTKNNGTVGNSGD